MPDNCFYHHICQWCSQRANNEHFKKCSRCRLVSYCSVEHQKLDWIVHKDFCRALDKLKWAGIFLFDFKGSSKEEWLKHRIGILNSVQLILKKKLEKYETQMILFPNVCSVCFKFNSEYHCCSTCLCVFYCCEEHLVVDTPNHMKHCEGLRKCFEFDLYKDVTNNIIFDSLTESFLNNISKSEHTDQKLDYMKKLHHDFEILIADTVTSVKSLVFGMMQSKKDELLNKLTELSIHILGCEEHEERIVAVFKIFFDLLPHVKLVKLLMIGPEFNVSSSAAIEIRSIGVHKLIINRVNNLYHKYASTNVFERPQILVAFNCGLSAFLDDDTWGETIKLIMNFNNVLLITTSYSHEEAVDDFSRLNSAMHSSSEIILKSCENPYRGVRPIRDCESSSVFYSNSFISVVFVRVD